MSTLVARRFKTETLIQAVKSRPSIYSKKILNSKIQKLQDWRAVSREVYSDYDQLNSQMKAERLFEVRRRWKNVRTCYARELALQKHAEPLGNPRKSYEYYHLLTFLPNQYEDAHPADNSACQNNSDDATSDTDIVKTSFLHAQPVKTVSIDEKNHFINQSDEASSDTAMEDMTTSFKAEKFEYIDLHGESVKSIDEQNDLLPRPNEAQLIEIIKDMKRDEDDADKQFIMSLLPSFKRLDEEKKLEAKIEILKILQTITYK